MCHFPLCFEHAIHSGQVLNDTKLYLSLENACAYNSGITNLAVTFVGSYYSGMGWQGVLQISMCASG